MRKASCARPISTSARGCPPSIRRRRGSIRTSRPASVRPIPSRDAADRATTHAIRACGRRCQYARFSPNLYPACQAAYRGPDGECLDRRRSRPAAATGLGQERGQEGQGRRQTTAIRRPRSICAPSPTNSSRKSTGRCPRPRPMNWRGVMAWSASRRRISRCSAAPSACSASSTGVRSRRCAANSPPTAACVRCSSNFRYFLQEQKKPRDRGRSPRNMRVAQLRLPQAHTLARGMNVTIAVIDSGVDAKHPELANSIADSFDALGSKEGPHVHGTGIAGAIVAHARLMGSAPEARILAIRAFGAAIEGRGEHVLRDPEGTGLCGRARRADHQHELCRPEGSADRAWHRRDRREGHPDGGRGRQCRARNRRRSIPPPIRT